jgi:hypothetical protein
MRLLAPFELGDWVLGQPSSADGEVADLAERDQDDAGAGRGEGSLVRM